MIGFWSIVNFTICQKNKILKCFLQMAGKHSTFFLTQTLHVMTSDQCRLNDRVLVNSYVYYGKKCKKVTLWDISEK